MNFFKINKIFSNTFASRLWSLEEAAPARALHGSLCFHQCQHCPAVRPSTRRLQACLHRPSRAFPRLYVCKGGIQPHVLPLGHHWFFSALPVCVSLSAQSCTLRCCKVSTPWCYAWSSELRMWLKLKYPSQHFPCHVNNHVTFSLTICLPQMPCEDCSEHVYHLLFLTETWGFLLRHGHSWNELTETTESWVSISKRLSCFHFFCAGSGLSTAYKALKALALKSKAEIMPSPIKRIIQLLSLPIILMWFWSNNWRDQHSVRLYSSCHSLTWHELAIKSACSAEAQNGASTERGS